MDSIDAFEQERARLTSLAARTLNDPNEAQDIVQQAWLRLHSQPRGSVENLPGWLTTVTMRLCLDRLRARIPEPVDDNAERVAVQLTPGEEVALADTVGVALHVVLDRLTPAERIAFVLHDSFGFDFRTISSILGGSTASSRKLASRARAKVAQPHPEDALADWQIVDAFLSAARGGDVTRLLELLAPTIVVTADSMAASLGTPERLEGATNVADFFNGAAKAARSVFVHGRPGAAWMHRGQPKVAFDFTVVNGRVLAIVFRAEPETLATLQLRAGGELDPRHGGAHR